jgi:predicted Mrr-cat superfamily restriction endonuclease
MPDAEASEAKVFVRKPRFKRVATPRMPPFPSPEKAECVAAAPPEPIKSQPAQHHHHCTQKHCAHPHCARQNITYAISSLSPFAIQNVVAALLRGMGYYTPIVAAPGPDGGTDVLAYRDPLGLKPPHIRVQVKHKVAKTSRQDIAALKGGLHHHREIGVFVSTGGFSQDAEREARTSDVHIELIDGARLIDLWIDVYDKLAEDDKNLLRLKKVYVLAGE